MRDKVSRPFVDFSIKLTADDLFMYSDASRGEEKGLGCIFNRSYSYAQWEKGFIREKQPSIAYLELYAICIGVFTWAHKLKNIRFTLYTDNKSARDMINSTTSGCKNCIRKLMLLGLQYNFRVFAKYVKSKDNSAADALSRLDMKRFRRIQIKNCMKLCPEPLPADIWPPSSIWMD